MKVHVPLQITSDMLGAGTTIPEPDASVGEVAWVAGGTYAVDNLRTDAGSVWSCVQAHTGHTAPPSSEPAFWLRKGPTNRMAAFDTYASTRTTGLESLTFVVSGAFFDGIVMWGLLGGHVEVTVRDEPGGDVVLDYEADLYEQALGLYELLFVPLRAITHITLGDIPLHPQAELTLTITSGEDLPVAIGTLQIGGWRPFTSGQPWEGTEYGGRASPQSFSYRQRNADGTWTIVPRGAATNVQCSVLVSRDQAEYVVATLQEIKDTPVAVVASDVPGYGYLNTIGLISGDMSPINSQEARLSFTVEGAI